MLIAQVAELFIHLHELVGDVLGVDGIRALLDGTAELRHPRGIHLGGIVNSLLECGELPAAPVIWTLSSFPLEAPELCAPPVAASGGRCTARPAPMAAVGLLPSTPPILLDTGILPRPFYPL